MDKFLVERVCLVEQTDTYQNQHALGDFLKFKEQFRGIAGQQQLVGFRVLVPGIMVV